MSKWWYDTAQICTKGHVTNPCSGSEPERNTKFCDECGAPTITNCQNCNTTIKGYHYTPGLIDLGYCYTPPSFCPDCGQSYPWTEAKLKAAQELANELDNLSPDERELLKKSLDDIVRDTPQTTVAATRFKRLVAKAGKPVADAFRDILVDIASEAAKKMIWPS